MRRLSVRLAAVLLAVWALLLIPEPGPPSPAGAGREAFAWDRQELWESLEERFRLARAEGGEDVGVAVGESLGRLDAGLGLLASGPLQAADPAFDALESELFHLAALAAAHPEHLARLQEAANGVRSAVKRQSEAWPIESRPVRERLYRALYGSRAAVEEAILQAPPDAVPALVAGDEEPCAGPSARVEGFELCSGDILVSRGGAATSALIARGNDFPGNFSHVALAQVDEDTGAVSVVESLSERGVVVASVEDYLARRMLRIMVLRLRADLPQTGADPRLPHQAASLALRDARSRHIPYDFAMDYRDPAKQFCSEVVSAAYSARGATLWMGMSHISSPGLIDWLASLGVRHFETQEPSDLEYDPQLRVVAEWRSPGTLLRDHVDNAVIDVLLEGAEAGERLAHRWYLLPPARLAKAWSVMRNRFGAVGPVPEGMSATTALRVDHLARRHGELAERVLAEVETFRHGRGYTPPYWELVRLAREAAATRG
jgi:hypothetical protein